MTDPLRAYLSDLPGRIGVKIGIGELDNLEAYLRLLERWNRTINLTGLPLNGFPARSLDRLVLEPLMAAEFVPPGSPRWLDVGSGGGSPAVPLKIVRPAAELTLIEARSRKVAFLQEIVRVLGLTSTTVVQARFGADRFGSEPLADLITVRAVRTDSSFWTAAASLTRHGGDLLMFRAGTSDLTSNGAGFSRIATKPLCNAADILDVFRRQ